MPVYIKIVAAILCVIVLPSAIRTMGFYSDEFWRFQQSLGGDKVMHMIVGASLMVVFISICKAFSSIKKLIWVFVLAAMVLIAEELFQLMTPKRHFEWVDMLWGLSGALAVLLFFVAVVFIVQAKNKK